jgi:hypothetical protein
VPTHLYENIPVRINIGNRPQTYINPSKQVPITIRVCDRVTLEYGSDGKFSFIVFQEMGGSVSAFYRTVARERVKRRFPILEVSAGNMFPRELEVGRARFSAKLLLNTITSDSMQVKYGLL